MKPILGALMLVPLMEAFAAAQEPTADAKEGKFYLEGGLGFGVSSMAFPSSSTSTGFDSIAVFGFGLAAEYGVTEQIGVFTKFGVGVGLDNDPGVTTFGMTFDGAFKLIEKKGDVPALSVYAGLGFVNIDVDPKGTGSDDATDFVFEFGVQTDIGPGDAWSLQPFAQIQLVAGSRPFKGYNGILQVSAGVKFLYKVADNIYLEPSVTFTGGNFQDSVMFGFGVQVRL
jgi:outer membrane protein with beta-barrel domain